MQWPGPQSQPGPNTQVAQVRADLIHQAAVDYLGRQGLQILSRDWRCTDVRAIVAAEQRVLVVCQITDRPFNPLLPIPRLQARRLRLAAVSWRAAHHVLFEEIRVDLIQVTGEPAGQFTFEQVRGVA